MPHIVSVETDRSWVTLADDPSGPAIVCGTRQGSSAGSTLDGEVRSYAGGRTRAVIRDQDSRTRPLTLRHLSPSELDRLMDWRGRVVLLRTTDGERMFCVYFSVGDRPMLRTTPEDGSDNVTYDADVTFTRVSYDESV